MMKSSKLSTFLLVSAGLISVLAGCSKIEQKMPDIGSIFSGTEGSGAVEGVYYVASPNLPLYRSPGGAIVTRLPQYTKLKRDKLEKGYAHVRVATTGETGWVENAKLTWRLPQTKPTPSQVTETPTSPPPQPAKAPEPPSPAAVSPPPTAVTPSSTSSESSVAPSIFNPY